MKIESFFYAGGNEHQILDGSTSARGAPELAFSRGLWSYFELRTYSFRTL